MEGGDGLEEVAGLEEGYAAGGGGGEESGRAEIFEDEGSAAVVVAEEGVGGRDVDRAGLASRSHNCPFHGRVLRGWPLASLVGGRLFRHDVGPAVRNRTT